jgi:plastocyanin
MILFIAALAIAAVSFIACGGNNDTGGSGGTGGGTANAVTITAKDFSFDTSTIDATAGEAVEVTLVNKDSTTHSFTSDDLNVDVEAEGGAQANTTFTADKAGSYEFHCKFHPDTMKGTIKVT